MIVLTCYFLLCAFHLLSLHYPVANMDEAAFVDWALHGSVVRWASVFPAPFKFLGNYYGFGGCPFHESVLRLAIRLLGFGIWQSRFVSAVAGLLALGVILNMLVRLRASRGVLIGFA